MLRVKIYLQSNSQIFIYLSRDIANEILVGIRREIPGD